MPALTKLSITTFRNIDSLSIRPVPGINVIHGENGSGKTSILEAIYLLGTARSFRSNQLKPVIQEGREESTVFGELENGTALGVSKSRRASQQIRINSRNAASAAELARSMPLQLLNADTFRILEGSPGERRRFLDWGVFHVEHNFYESWRQMQRTLQNRNSLLKSGASSAEIEPWTRELARAGELVDCSRRSYVEKLLPVLGEVLACLIQLERLQLDYDRGWDREQPLLQVLHEGLERDGRYGHTVQGPQRADLKIRLGGQYAVDVLSRGQQKLLVGAMKLAEGLLLERESGKRCLYLIDDLPAELDRRNRAALCRFLEGMRSQVFISCVEEDALADCWSGDQENKLFHVKHGKI